MEFVIHCWSWLGGNYWKMVRRSCLKPGVLRFSYIPISFLNDSYHPFIQSPMYEQLFTHPISHQPSPPGRPHSEKRATLAPFLLSATDFGTSTYSQHYSYSQSPPTPSSSSPKDTHSVLKLAAAQDTSSSPKNGTNSHIGLFPTHRWGSSSPPSTPQISLS